jgi:hypothetical protein
LTLPSGILWHCVLHCTEISSVSPDYAAPIPTEAESLLSGAEAVKISSPGGANAFETMPGRVIVTTSGETADSPAHDIQHYLNNRSISLRSDFRLGMAM